MDYKNPILTNLSFENLFEGYVYAMTFSPRSLMLWLTQKSLILRKYLKP